MKKLLPLLGLALLAGSASAQTGQVLEHQCILKVSPNGKWAVSEDAMFSCELNIIDLEKGEIVAGPFGGEWSSYQSGIGNCVSNDGIVLGSSDPYETQPQYFENGEWKTLPTPENAAMTGSFANGITPDGSRICGYAQILQYEGDEYGSAHPCVWYRNADGTYAQPIVLPEPTIDFTGRKAQHTLVHCISEDGKTISGLFTDYSGFINQPIVYKESADGTWSYELINQNELYHLDEVEFPQFSIEEPDYVDYMDYMSEASLAAYEQAMNDYYAGTLTEWPYASEYMTPEELAAYEAAQTEYERLSELYWEEYSVFAEVFEPYIGTIPMFEMNNECMSPNGKYMLSTSSVDDPNADPMSWPIPKICTPYLFDLEAGTFKMVNSPKNIAGLQVLSDGTILGVNNFYDPSYHRNAHILLPNAEDFIALNDYVAPVSANLAKWMEENMTHEVPVYKLDEEGNYVVDEFGNVEVDYFDPQLFLGQPQASDDLSVVATWVYNSWDEDGMAPYYYSYIFKLGAQDGVNDLLGDNETLVLKGQKGGVIEVQGVAQELKVYDLNGREVYSSDEVAASVETGLAQGVYVAKALNANGETVVAKLAL